MSLGNDIYGGFFSEHICKNSDHLTEISQAMSVCISVYSHIVLHEDIINLQDRGNLLKVLELYVALPSNLL